MGGHGADGRTFRVCPARQAGQSYLQLGLKSPWVRRFFSFKIIISWSSRRKASRLIWFRNLLRSLVFSGLRSALYLAFISPNGSYDEIGTDEAQAWGGARSLGAAMCVQGGEGPGGLTFLRRSSCSDLWAERSCQRAMACLS